MAGLSPASFAQNFLDTEIKRQFSVYASRVPPFNDGLDSTIRWGKAGSLAPQIGGTSGLGGSSFNTREKQEQNKKGATPDKQFTLNEIGRVTKTKRVENPQDSEQWVDVEYATQIQLQREGDNAIYTFVLKPGD